MDNGYGYICTRGIPSKRHLIGTMMNFDEFSGRSIFTQNHVVDRPMTHADKNHLQQGLKIQPWGWCQWIQLEDAIDENRFLIVTRLATVGPSLFQNVPGSGRLQDLVTFNVTRSEMNVAFTMSLPPCGLTMSRKKRTSNFNSQLLGDAAVSWEWLQPSIYLPQPLDFSATANVSLRVFEG